MFRNWLIAYAGNLVGLIATALLIFLSGQYAFGSAAIGLNIANAKASVHSRRGEMIVKALITDRVPAGLVFGKFHFLNEQNINNLTIGNIDPIAKIPEYKVCAVRVERFVS